MKITNFRDDTILRYEVSDGRERIERYPDHVDLTAGGFADSAGTHYARLKLSHPFPVGRGIVMRMVVTLPPNFYDVRKASFKLMTCGTGEPYQRMGVWIASDGFPRLQVERKGQLLRTLWTGTQRLPVGRNLVRLLAIPSAVEGQALLRLSVNGTPWGESRAPNIPDQINRVVFGIDGAADQDGEPMSLSIAEVEVR